MCSLVCSSSKDDELQPLHVLRLVSGQYRSVKDVTVSDLDSSSTLVGRHALKVSVLFLDSIRKPLELKRPGLNFYALRHTFETIAGESMDQVAVNHIMGHVDNSMAAAYRERISDDRLRAVVEMVRGWLKAAAHLTVCV